MPWRTLRSSKEGASADSAEEMKDTAGVNPWRLHSQSRSRSYLIKVPEETPPVEVLPLWQLFINARFEKCNIFAEPPLNAASTCNKNRHGLFPSLSSYLSNIQQNDSKEVFSRQDAKRAKKKILLFSPNLASFALWSISPGRDNPTRSSCYSTGRVILFPVPPFKSQRNISNI